MAYPQILAPAGNRESFLAALAAGADAVYAGLKHFSARMQADNFSSSELAALTDLAREYGAQVFVAMNTLVKPNDPRAAGSLLDRLSREVRPDGVIVQDPAMLELVRQTGFPGEVHLSTLANVSFPAGLAWARERWSVDRVVLPRELNIDEVKYCAKACPPGLSLEVFVHGALCYNVSGRCYWSSFLGGKSGLRGRCVQPCRRVYASGGRKARFFSCRDLSLDVLTGPLLDVPEISAWKIEGRKKGPHYVFYTVAAYKLLRDQRADTRAKKEAQDLLSRALGRPGTHYTFLPQKPYDPTEPDSDTGSGLLAARVSSTPKAELHIKPRFPLLPGDVLRVGSEDEPWHRTIKLGKRVPKGGRLDLRQKGGKPPKSGTPVFLLDRREPELKKLLSDMGARLGKSSRSVGASSFEPRLPKIHKPKGPRGPRRVYLRRSPVRGKQAGTPGLWLTRRSFNALSKTMAPKVWWWLPPVIWPEEEGRWAELCETAARAGARTFVLNQPWQAAFFESFAGKLELWAGPYCNIANPLALGLLKDSGFSGAFPSQELGREEFLALPGMSPLPLGIVTKGLWPLGLSRAPAEHFRQSLPLESPMGEICYARDLGGTTWIYPNWPLDLSGEEPLLAEAGYQVFVHLQEPPAKAVPRADRASTFNWDLQLL